MAHEGVILLVEDDRGLNDANRRALELRRYTVHSALTLGEARGRLDEAEPDVILLDVMLPDGDGFAFCQEIREKTQAHILFLTAKTEHEDMVRGLTDGGDDYITKPFHVEELLARVEAAMRRRRIGVPVQTITKGSLTLDVVAAQAFAGGRDLLLSQKEFAILLLLAQNEGKVMSAGAIYEKVWGLPMADDRNAVQTALSKLRKKIKHTGYDISAVRGQGYMFGRA
jgi:DNA-binding response OmpR family regulator